MATSCIASTASVRNPPMTKSTLSCVSARSMALVASGTLCISFESTLTISIGCFWLPTLNTARFVDFVPGKLGARPMVFALDKGHRPDDSDFYGFFGGLGCHDYQSGQIGS